VQGVLNPNPDVVNEESAPPALKVPEGHGIGLAIPI